MIRVTKLADYGIVLMTCFGQSAGSGRLASPLSAQELARETGLPLPTVAKILRALSRHGLLCSVRGARGGYLLSRPAEDISIADLIEAVEGPIALTECLSPDGERCDVESFCPTRSNWGRINRAIRCALEGISLAEMARPQSGWRKKMGASLTAATASLGPQGVA